MKILFIYNPNSGDESGKEFVGEVEDYLKKYFEEVILRETKERMITDEVVRGMGGTIASRFSRLDKRREDAERINRMFGLDIKVSYKDISSVLSGDELLLFANYPNEGAPGGDLDE